MSKPTDQVVREILEKCIKLSTKQKTKPPYTEDNRPTGLIYISGIEEAQAQLTRHFDERFEEAVGRYDNNNTGDINQDIANTNANRLKKQIKDFWYAQQSGEKEGE